MNEARDEDKDKDWERFRLEFAPLLAGTPKLQMLAMRWTFDMGWNARDSQDKAREEVGV